MNLAAFILVSVPLLVQHYARQFKAVDYAKTLQELSTPSLGLQRRVYDFIVVGGGSGGSTVAGRLSEHGFNVLLLEAGGDPDPITDVPGLQPQVGFDPEINYMFTSVPQPNAGQDNGGIFTTSFGRMLGGSGSHNDMVYNRGSPHDFDNWAKITGDSSWRYEAVLSHFKRYENFVGALVDGGRAKDAYGHSGPLTVNTTLNLLTSAWLEAARELGYDVADPNGRQMPSFTPQNVFIGRGERVSSYKGFVKPFEGRRLSLTVLRYSDVEEVLIDTRQKAYGVKYKRHGIPQRAYASKEVILSGGAVRSPLLLMKSGVGPAEVLSEAGIPLRVERSGVGRNLADHVAIGLSPIYVQDSSLLPRPRVAFEVDAATELRHYARTGAGILAINGEGPQALLASSRAKAAGESNWPDTQIQLIHASLTESTGPDQDFLQMFVVNGRPRSRGSLRLNGTAWRAGERDDQKLAIIDLQLLADPGDVQVLLDGIRVGLCVFQNTTAFRSARAAVDTPTACSNLPVGTDSYWRCYIRQGSTNWYHFVGSNSMGRVEDPMAVVDSKMKVIGVKGLRVVDASVMPVLPNANINAPTIMLGEKAAEEIRKEYQAPVAASLRGASVY